MFYYYGRKYKMAHLYPEPLYDTIIEPFAGSAAYSLSGNRWQRNVSLNDKNDIVVRIWRYLIEYATKEILLALPNVKPGEDIRQHTQLVPEERFIIGFAINPGSVSPGHTATTFSRWRQNQKYIANTIHKVKHWTITHKDYTEVTSKDRSTWFIDPPYQKMGYRYTHQIDYSIYAAWVYALQGQIICCENANATYLPFTPIASLKSAGKKSNIEAVYITHV